MDPPNAERLWCMTATYFGVHPATLEVFSAYLPRAAHLMREHQVLEEFEIALRATNRAASVRASEIAPFTANSSNLSSGHCTDSRGSGSSP